MPKRVKSRDLELHYIEYHNKLKLRRKCVKQDCVPWQLFFEGGKGSEIRTKILRSSIYSIVYSHGRKMGKRFKCSYEQDGDTLVVKLNSIEDR